MRPVAVSRELDRPSASPPAGDRSGYVVEGGLRLGEAAGVLALGDRDLQVGIVVPIERCIERKELAKAVLGAKLKRVDTFCLGLRTEAFRREDADVEAA